MFIGMSLVVLFFVSMLLLPLYSERREKRKLAEMEAITDAIDSSLLVADVADALTADRDDTETSYHRDVVQQ